jgi:hypothetical protein
MEDPKKGQDNADNKKVSAKGQRKGRAHAVNHDHGKNKDTKDVSKHGSEAENIPEEINPPKNLKDRILRWMDHQVYVVTMVVVTVLALFMVDVVSTQTPRLCNIPYSNKHNFLGLSRILITVILLCLCSGKQQVRPPKNWI